MLENKDFIIQMRKSELEEVVEVAVAKGIAVHVKTQEREQLLTPSSAGELVGRTGTTIINWCNRGHLKATRVNGKLFIKRGDLEDLINKGFKNKHIKD